LVHSQTPRLAVNALLLKAAANRLMKNQEDIGDAVAKFYGAPAGQQLTTLLKEHITIAVDLIKAAKPSDKAAQQADNRWQQNAMQIGDFLGKANPNWPKDTLAGLMKEHLSTTTNRVVARLNNRARPARSSRTCSTIARLKKRIPFVVAQPPAIRRVAPSADCTFRKQELPRRE
jgi:hypothetical protein